MGMWDNLFKRWARSKMQDLLTQFNTNGPIYPEGKDDFYLQNYSKNGDVFSIINKITEPAARVPIEQVNIKTGESVEGKTIQLLRKPNPFQSQTEFLEGALTFFNIFGNCYIAGERPEFGLRTGQVTRLDLLPPQWVEIMLGSFMDPIKGYRLTEAYEQDKIYEFGQVLHWREFNPEYDINGKHMYGMSRLKPLINNTTALQAGYDSLVSAFQNGGAHGVLTILGVRDNDGKYNDKPTTKEQLAILESYWKRKWAGAERMGAKAITNKSVEWTPFGMSVHDMSILSSLPISRGVIADAYNVPEVLLANSESKTYMNYQEAMKALWNNAIIPNLDGLLNKLNDWLIPAMGEQGTMLVADYDSIPALQSDKKELVDWMTRAGLTYNEIRDALGYETMNIPNMDVPIISMGVSRVDEIGFMPSADFSEEALKRLGVEDYRENKA